MDKKYRVNELAKDLNISVSEITDVVQEYFGVQKKSQASLSEDELSVVLEKYSQSNQVKNFNSYFASASKPKTEKKEEKPAESEEMSQLFVKVALLEKQLAACNQTLKEIKELME